MSSKKEEELLKKRLKKLFGNDPNIAAKNVERILKGSSSSNSDKFFNRRQSSSSLLTSTAIDESNVIKKKPAPKTQKKENKSKTPNYNCSIINSKPKKTAKKTSNSTAQLTQNSQSTKSNGQKVAAKRQSQKKVETELPAKKVKKQIINESIEWNPEWSRDSDCSCSACQTPSDCSCSHCEESRQNGTKKKKKLTKKKNKSKISCNTADFECFNTSDFDSDFDPCSSTNSRTLLKSTTKTKSGNSSKKENNSTAKGGKYVKKRNGTINENNELDIVNLNIVKNATRVNAELAPNNGLQNLNESNATTPKKCKKSIKTKNCKKNNKTDVASEDKPKKSEKKKSKIETKPSAEKFEELIGTTKLKKNCETVARINPNRKSNYIGSEDDKSSYSDLYSDSDSFLDSFLDSLDSYDSDDSLMDEYSNSEDGTSEDYFYSDLENDSNDTDYKLPDNVNDDLYIASGTAIKHEINKDVICFDSDCTEAQIVEMPNDQKKKLVEKNVNSFEQSIFKPSLMTDILKDQESEDSCPELVPISYEATNSMSENDYSFEDYTSDEYTSEDYTSEEHTCAYKRQRSSDTTDEFSDHTSMEPTIHTMKVLPNSSPTFLELEPDKLPEDEIDFSITKSNQMSADCEVVMLEDKDSQNKHELGCEIVNFRTQFFNSIDSLQVLVLLKDPIFIYGTLKVQLIAGMCDIFGYKPKLGEKVEVFSPRGYSFLNIQVVQNLKETNTKENIGIEIMEKYSANFLNSDLEELLINYNGKNSAICLLERNDRSKKFEMIKKYNKQNLIPNMNSITLQRPFFASEFILRCIIRTKTDNAMITDPKWETIKIENSTKLMIIGGKSVGKSTLLRYIVNRNIAKFGKILLIDLDIGQSEIFVPQTFSVTILDRPLLGPGYFLNIQPKKSILFGDINVVINPFRYIENIRDLLEFCYQEKEFQNIPWVINTMGYNKGVGSEIIVQITKYLKPTDIIQLKSSKEINNFDHIMYSDVMYQIPLNIFDTMNENFITNHRLILFDSIINNKKKSTEWDMKPKDIRYAILITRLGAILDDKYDWLTDCKPFCAPIKNVNIVSFGDDKLSKQDLLQVINANLVYLCKQSESNKTLECYGIGLVRGIDNFQENIYLLPSIHNNLLANVNCLAVCNMPLPTSIYLNQGPKIKDITPYAYNTNQTSSSKYVTQIFYRPNYFFNTGVKNQA